MRASFSAHRGAPRRGEGSKSVTANTSREFDEDAPIFAMGKAAEYAGMHPQTLRQYDRLGLVVPQRTAGNTRRYSLRDVSQLREIARLSSEGVSLTGIARIIEMQNVIRDMEKRVSELESALEEQKAHRPGGPLFAASSFGDVIPLRTGMRPQARNEIVVWRPMSRAARY